MTPHCHKNNNLNCNIDYNDSKNILIFAIMLSLGVSGLIIPILNFNLSGVALSIIVGILLNLILK